MGALVLGFAGIDEVREYHDLYRETSEKRTGERFVSSVQNDLFSALLPTIVLDDGDEAFRIGARGQRFFAESIAHWYAGAPEPNEDTENDDNVAAMARNADCSSRRLHEANIPVTPTSTAHLQRRPRLRHRRLRDGIRRAARRTSASTRSCA